MKRNFLLVAIFAMFMVDPIHAASNALETGFFNDEVGFVDEITNQKVADAQNLMGYRYIGIETNMKGLNVKDVKAFDKNNKPIKTGTPLNISTTTINGVEQENAYLKIWLEMPEGTSFKLIYYFK